MSTGGCEAAVWLPRAEADRLLSAFIDFMHYSLPEIQARRDAGLE
jgi:hypothetical protein